MSRMQKHFLLFSRVEKGISPAKKVGMELMILFRFFLNLLRIVSANANILVRTALERCLRYRENLFRDRRVQLFGIKTQLKILHGWLNKTECNVMVCMTIRIGDVQGLCDFRDKHIQQKLTEKYGLSYILSVVHNENFLLHYSIIQHAEDL